MNQPTSTPPHSLASARGSLFAPLAVVVALAIGVSLAGCSPTSSAKKNPNLAAPDLTIRSTPAPALPPSSSASDPYVESIEDWTYNSRPGRIIRTSNYRLFTTQSDTVLSARVPMFVEKALEHYRSAFARNGELLPQPALKLDTFVLANRTDWAMLTKQLTGDQADLYLRIPRGGFAFSGKALLYDIGPRDTLSILAHEGWHQYTQRTFKQPLPIWLEEGLGTYMEGHKWTGSGGLTPSFLPWCNTERFDQLRKAESQGRLLGLKELLDSAPQDLMNHFTDDALTFYAQVWALTHFLEEGAEGRYRAALADLLNDASKGSIDRRISAVLGPSSGRKILMFRRGPGVFLAYFNQDIDMAAKEYDQFIKKLVSPGSRSAIVAGESPIANARP